MIVPFGSNSVTAAARLLSLMRNPIQIAAAATSAAIISTSNFFMREAFHEIELPRACQSRTV
jgi:hypothetical protein